MASAGRTRPAPPHWLLLHDGATIGLHASQEEVRAVIKAWPAAEWAALAYRDCDCADPAVHEAEMAAREEMR